MAEKIYRFASKWLGFTVWVGDTKVRFQRGAYETTNVKLAEALRKHSECTEIIVKAEQEEKPEIPEKTVKSSKSAGKAEAPKEDIK